MKMRWARSTVVAAVLAFAAAGCGGSGGSPQQQLRAALDEMSGWPGVTMTVRLDSDAESLKALFSAEGQKIPEEVIGHLLNASLRISSPTDADPAVTALSPFQLAISVGDDALFEVRGSGETAYLRLDLPRAIGLVGQGEDMTSEIEAMLASALPPNALRGQWLALTGAAELMAAMTGDMATPTPGPDQEAALERLGNALANAAEVESDGSDSAGERLLLRGNVRELYDAVKAEAGVLGLPLGEMPDRAELPDELVEIVVWVRDGVLTQMKVDVLQFAAMESEAEIPEGVERLGIMIEVEQFSGEIEVPGDAVELNAQQLMQTFFETMGGMFMGGDSGSMPGVGASGEAQPMDPSQMFDDETRAEYCAQVADMPQEMIDEHFAEMCPELASS